MVVVLLLAGTLLRSPTVPVAAPIGASPTPGMNHECWIGPDDSINGCRMHDGSVVGYPEGSPTVCYFTEPLPTGDYTIRCRD